MTPELDGLVSYGPGAGAKDDACGVGEELVASGAAMVKVGDRLGTTGGAELVAPGDKIWVKVGATGGEELLASGTANVENGVKLGETDREELVGSGAAKVKTVGKLVATGEEELVASGAANVKTGNKLCATVGEELVASDAAKVKTGVIDVSLVLDGGWIAGVLTWLVSGATILDGAGAWKTGAKGVVLALEEDF